MENLLSLPHIDIICEHIFCYVPLRDLINLYNTDESLESLVLLYIEKHCKIFDYSEMNGLKNPFQEIIENRTDIKGFIFKKCKWLDDEKIAPFLMNNKHLIHLNLEGCHHITDLTADRIAHLLDLEHLNLLLCTLNFSLEAFGRITENLFKLRYLNIESGIRITNEAIQSITENNKNLEALYINGKNITSDGFRSIAENLNQLKHLSLLYCKNIENNDLENIVINNKRLVSLELEYGNEIKMNCIGINLQHLKELVVPDLNDNDLKIITEENKNLEKIYMYKGSNLTPTGIENIGKNLKKLKFLNFEDCMKINDKNLNLIVSNNKNLVGLNLNGCAELTTTGFNCIG